MAATSSYRNGSSSAPINLQVIQNNFTNDEQEFRYNQIFNNNLLDRQNEFAVSVTRLKVPCSKIESFVIKDKSKYYFTLSSTNITNSANYQLATAIEYLPDETGLTEDPNEYVGPVRYYSPKQMIDLFNRVLFRLWIGYCRLWPNYQIDSGILIANWKTTQQASWTKNIVVTAQPNSFIANVELRVYRFITSNTPITSTDASTFTPVDLPTKLTLIHPDGTEVIVYSGGLASYIDLNNYDTNRYVKFSEGAYNTCSKITLEGSNRPYRTYLPYAESFLKLQGKTTISGTWVLKYDTFANTYGEMAFALHVDTLPTGFDLPQTPPAFDLDSSDNRLSLTLEENFIKSDITIGMSSTMKSMIDFGPLYHVKNNLIGASNDYIFKPPPIILDSSLVSKTYTYKQDSPHLSSLSNIERLLLTTSSMSVENDFIYSNTALTYTNQLADFTLDLSQDGLSDLIYTTDASIMPWRRYALKSPNSLANMGLDCVVVYTNGLQKTLVLPPNSNFLARLSFFRV